MGWITGQIRHDQQTTKFIDSNGETQGLRRQHIQRVASVPLPYQLGDTLIEDGQFAQQPFKLLLNRIAPSL
jgi:hypothetical protein